MSNSGLSRLNSTLLRFRSHTYGFRLETSTVHAADSVAAIRRRRRGRAVHVHHRS